jgi:transcriptional regulator with XRE-family HTH domain
LSQAELAGRANIGQATLQRMESGKGGTLQHFLRVVMALGLIDELAGLFELKVRSIAELERTAAPTRQRAPARRKPAKPSTST